MINESILPFTFLQSPVQHGSQPPEEGVFDGLGCGARPLYLSVVPRHQTGLAVAGLRLLQTPDCLAALVLGQETLTQVVVGVGKIELGLQLEVSSPVTELCLVQGVKVVSRSGEHLAGLVRQS